jgi:anti-sigma B factor antagonist
MCWSSITRNRRQRTSAFPSSLAIVAAGMPSCKFESRLAGDVTIIDLSGRLTLGDPVASFRDEVSAQVSAQVSGKIVLNLAGLDYIDSAGLGELIATNKSASLRLVNVSKRVEDLMRLSNCHSLFAIHPNEQSAIADF